MIFLKRTLLLTILSLATCLHAFAQSRKLSDEEINHSTVSKIKWADTTNCVQIDEWIKSDIKNKTIFLFLSGGIAPVIYTSDKTFEDKYDIHYFDFGCVAPDDKCVIKYNYMVFEYLTKTFGKVWLKDIRKDITGLQEWKKRGSKSAQN